MQNEKPSGLAIVSYLIAAAIVVPIGWWLKSNNLFGFGDWVMGFLH